MWNLKGLTAVHSDMNCSISSGELPCLIILEYTLLYFTFTPTLIKHKLFEKMQ